MSMLQARPGAPALMPIPMPMCPWQVMSSDFFTFDGDEW